MWYAFWVFFSPVAFLISLVLCCGYGSSRRQDLRQYSIETWYRLYKIFTDDDNRINRPILALDIINILWGMTGTYLSIKLKNENSKADGIFNCIRDYGLPSTLMAMLYILLAYLKIIRMIFYQVHFIYHREIFGHWEQNSRRDVRQISDSDQNVSLKFLVIPYQKKEEDLEEFSLINSEVPASQSEESKSGDKTLLSQN